MGNSFSTTLATGTNTPYCTVAQFKQRYDERMIDQLSTDDNTRNPNDTNIQVALDDAGDELDSGLRTRYAIPPRDVNDKIPHVLVRWTAARAMERLFGRRTDHPATLQREWDWCDEWLDRIIMRHIGLPGIGPSSTPSLDSTENNEGKSRFDAVPFLDRSPTDTSTSRGKVLP